MQTCVHKGKHVYVGLGHGSLEPAEAGVSLVTFTFTVKVKVLGREARQRPACLAEGCRCTPRSGVSPDCPRKTNSTLRRGLQPW